jgi:polysaccharide export outer membrane protein
MRTTLASAVILSLLFAGCGSDDMTKENLTQIIRSGSRSVQAEAQQDSYVIRQGDQIQLSVWGYPEFDSKTEVKELGEITLPQPIGDMTAAGLTKQQFTQQMTRKLSEYIQGEIKITLTVVSSTPQKVTVLGEVLRQENYPLTTDATLIEILSTAGGLTAESDMRNIKILRAGQNRQPIEVDLAWYMENGNVEAIPIIRPGDTVFIPKRSNIIRELSEFMRDAIFLFGFFEVFK